MKQLNDQYFNYRQTPVEFDGVAKPSIKGNTLVWNQLVDSGTSSVALTSGHIYITKVGTSWSRVSGTGQSISVTGGSDCVFDLTKMFGSGNEPTTVEEFTSFFPLPYYAYNSGSLLNFNGSGIKTTGKNLLPSQSVGSVTGVSIVENNGVYTLNGTSSGYQQAISTSTVILPKGTYTLYSNGGDNNVVGVQIRSVDGTVTYASSFANASNFTLTEQIEVKFRIVLYASTFVNKQIAPQLEFGSTATSYEPYTSSTTSLPISTYFPTGMKSAGDVYDELSDKAITRVGDVDLGSLTWTYDSQNTVFRGAVSDIKRQLQTDLANLLCPMYRTNTQNQVVGLNADMCISTLNWGDYVVVRNNAYTDADVFKTAMDGVMLNYELATPTEVDAEPIKYNFYGKGTEQLLPVNTDTPSTSPLLANIIYYNLTDSEVPYRVFWMINSKGERWDFTDREFKSFLNNPQGLGFSKTFSVNRYGNVQNLTDITDNFPQPNGEVLFYDSSNSTRYDKYNSFVKFLSYEPITLYYKIPVSYYSRIPNTYSIECVVGTLTKTESKTDNILNCSITFNALSFYKGEEVVINGAIAGTGYFHVKNDGDFPVGFEIMATGSVSNPVVTLKQDDELYGEAKFIDATAFSKVYIDSNDGEQNLILEQGGSAVPNPMSYQDLSISNGSIYVTFIKLARGESTIMIDGTAGSFTSATIRFTPIYRSV